MTYTNRNGLRIADELVDFIDQQVLPRIGIGAAPFWEGTSEIFRRFTPLNRALLAKREELQTLIDAWHLARAGQSFDPPAYREFLLQIGYLVAEPPPFRIDPGTLDREIAAVAGPQLVVPIMNARFLLNAANARWGSLYDALYGTDAIAELPKSADYDAERGDKVVAWARAFLDAAVPLIEGSWTKWEGGDPMLADPAQWIARSENTLLLRHHGLHIEVVIDRDHPIGRNDMAGIADILLESAVSTICDLEDSVAAVDAADKVAAYNNWLGLMTSELEECFEKAGVVITRRLNGDRHYTARDGSPFSLPGRSLLLVRNVGHLMTTSAVLLEDGTEAPEGILDTIITSAIAKHDLLRSGGSANSRTGSVYIVKPKMHGPDECAFANDLFDAVEDLLELPRYSIKIGVMDEERRTSANLAACIHAVKNRIFFINTGFLDRTGDEIHTSMHAGPMLRKGEMKTAPWITAYEDRNVQIGLACGFLGKAQIGKGMWAMPDRMADMLQQKIAHPLSGANTAWVPSPTAATLHATHYHKVDVAARQAERRSEPIAPLATLLTLPVATDAAWSLQERQAELDNNAQGILGYVVRWIDQGIGCSKVLDINDVGLMEDRATLRISSQHISNWLTHAVVTPAEVDAALLRMAARVDAQNADDKAYHPMSHHAAKSLAFQAARSLVFEGANQPSGYTEPLLHHYRSQNKVPSKPQCE